VSDDNEILRVALRVLSAVCEYGGRPNIADVVTLRRYAPMLADGPVDLLAREIIRGAMTRRNG
jgi:hypothetical protein